MYIKNWMKTHVWLIVLTGVLIGFLLPKQAIFLKPYLVYLLMVLMFFSCLSIDLKHIIKELKDYKKKLVVLAIIHLASPLVVLLLKPFLSAELFLGLILATTFSSGLSVVFLSHIYGGVVSEALVVTSISNILSPITVPALVLLFAQTTIEIDAWAMSKTMMQMVLIPLIIGTIIRHTRLQKPMMRSGDYISIIIVFLIVAGIVAPVRDIIISHYKEALFLFIIISCLTVMNFLLGRAVGKGKKEKITYGITTTYKNFGLATVLALSLFTPLVALPAIVYTVVNNLFLIPLQLIFAKR